MIQFTADKIKSRFCKFYLKPPMKSDPTEVVHSLLSKVSICRVDCAALKLKYYCTCYSVKSLLTTKELLKWN